MNRTLIFRIAILAIALSTFQAQAAWWPPCKWGFVQMAKNLRRQTITPPPVKEEMVAREPLDIFAYADTDRIRTVVESKDPTLEQELIVQIAAAYEHAKGLRDTLKRNLDWMHKQEDPRYSRLAGRAVAYNARHVTPKRYPAWEYYYYEHGLNLLRHAENPTDVKDALYLMERAAQADIDVGNNMVAERQLYGHEDLVSPEVLSLVLLRAGDSDTSVRRSVAVILSHYSQDAGAHQALTTLSGDSDPSVATAARNALTFKGAGRAALKRKSSNHGESKEQTQAINEALQKGLPFPIPKPLLEDPFTRQAAVNCDYVINQQDHVGFVWKFGSLPTDDGALVPQEVHMIVTRDGRVGVEMMNISYKRWADFRNEVRDLGLPPEVERKWLRIPQPVGPVTARFEFNDVEERENFFYLLPHTILRVPR